MTQTYTNKAANTPNTPNTPNNIQESNPNTPHNPTATPSCTPTNTPTAVTITEAKTKRELKTFAQFANRLYRHSPQYVPDLETDIIHSFSPKHNPGLAVATAVPFLAWKDGQCVGRVAAIINRRANERWQTRTVRFGMLDFIDDIDVSRALIEKVAEWGRAQGMDQIEGPLGITDFDKEGMLISDFDRLSQIITTYNHPYYPQHMDRLGLEKAADWVQIRLTLPDAVPERYLKTAKLLQQMLSCHVRILTPREIRDTWGLRIFELLNQAYAPLFGFSEISPAQAQAFVDEYLPLLDVRMMPVVVDDNDNLLAAAVTMGSLSTSMQRTHGKLFPLGWAYLLWQIKVHHADTVDLMLIGVRPDLQGMGLTALIFSYLIPLYRKLGYRYAETGPQLENNVKELSQWRYLEHETIKRRRCYRWGSQTL